MTAEAKQECRVIIVGDTNVGKTSMALAYCTRQFPGDYIQYYNLGHVFAKDLNPSLRLTIDDAEGGDDYDGLRPLCYPEKDMFIIAFAVDSRASFERVRSKWVPEIQRFCSESKKQVPMILVGTKTDLRDESAVSTSEGEKCCEQIGAEAYFECSSLRVENLDAPFEFAANDYSNPVSKFNHKRKCIIK